MSDYDQDPDLRLVLKEARRVGIGLRHDCPRCGTRHLISCCHASRHNLCDLCVHEQHEQRASEVRTPPEPTCDCGSFDGGHPGDCAISTPLGPGSIDGD